MSENEDNEELSLRDELEAAIEAEESTNEEQTETEDTTEEAEATENESGEPEPEPTKEQEPIGDAEGSTTPPGINAPIGFTPQAREQWASVPDVVKEQIQKREQEIEVAVRGVAESRRTHKAITDLSNSYASVMAAEGAENPMQAIEGMFKTVAELRVGSPQQAAGKMAQLIQHYGVDIQMLDQALSGQEVQSTEVSQMQQMLDQRLAPLQQMYQQQQQGQQVQQQQAQQQVNDELKTFSDSAEFINDVRYDMADLIDMASKQGRKMTFQDAYDKCCAMNPNISKVLADRATAQQLTSSGEAVARKRNANSSLSANSGGASTTPKDLSLRGELESLWDGYE